MTTPARIHTLEMPLFGAYLPGTYVRHPDRPEWGLGQIQSAVGHRVTVNFEHAGKVLVITDHIDLRIIDPRELTSQ